ELDCTWTPCAIVWSQLHDEPMGLQLYGDAVATDSEGNIVVAAQNDPGVVPEERMPVMRFDGDGDLLWSEIPLELRTDSRDVVVTANDDIIAIGAEWALPDQTALVSLY